MIEKRNLECEIACAKMMVDELKRILNLDLSNFEGKVLNCKFDKAIGHPVNRESTNSRYFNVYPEKNFIWTKTEKGQTNTFTQWQTKHRIIFSIDESTNRINQRWFKSGVQTAIGNLTESILLYEKDLTNYDKYMSEMKTAVDRLTEMSQKYSYIMRSNMRDMLKRI